MDDDLSSKEYVMWCVTALLKVTVWEAKETEENKTELKKGKNRNEGK